MGTGHRTRIRTRLEDGSSQQQCRLIQQRAHTFERAGSFLLSVLALARAGCAARGARQCGVAGLGVVCGDLFQLRQEGTHLRCQQAGSARDVGGEHAPVSVAGDILRGSRACQTGRNNHIQQSERSSGTQPCAPREHDLGQSGGRGTRALEIVVALCERSILIPCHHTIVRNLPKILQRERA